MAALDERAKSMHELLIDMKPGALARILPTAGCFLVALALLFTFVVGIETIAGWFNAK